MRISDWSSDVCSSDLMLRRTDVIWPYETEGVPALNGRRLSWPRGTVVGGSSSVNGTIFIRGLREEYDRWRQLGHIGKSEERRVGKECVRPCRSWWSTDH